VTPGLGLQKVGDKTGDDGLAEIDSGEEAQMGRGGWSDLREGVGWHLRRGREWRGRR